MVNSAVAVALFFLTISMCLATPHSEASLPGASATAVSTHVGDKMGKRRAGSKKGAEQLKVTGG